MWDADATESATRMPQCRIHVFRLSDGVHLRHWDTGKHWSNQRFNGGAQSSYYLDNVGSLPHVEFRMLNAFEVLLHTDVHMWLCVFNVVDGSLVRRRALPELTSVIARGSEVLSLREVESASRRQGLDVETSTWVVDVYSHALDGLRTVPLVDGNAELFEVREFNGVLRNGQVIVDNLLFV